MKTEIEQLRKEFNERIDALLKEDKPKFEVGNWVKVIDGKNGAYGCNGNIGMVINSPLIEPENLSGVLFENAKFFIQLPCGKIWSFRNDVVVVPATPEEVYAALVKEADKIGFKEGVRFISPSGTNYGYSTSKGGCLTYDKYNGYLCWNRHGNNDGTGCHIFSNGQWATIIKDDVIKVGGYEVIKRGDVYKIGCKNFTRSSIANLAALMFEQNFKKVYFDGIETDLKTIEKILSL